MISVLTLVHGRDPARRVGGRCWFGEGGRQGIRYATLARALLELRPGRLQLVQCHDLVADQYPQVLSATTPTSRLDVGDLCQNGALRQG